MAWATVSEYRELTPDWARLAEHCEVGTALAVTTNTAVKRRSFILADLLIQRKVFDCADVSVGSIYAWSVYIEPINTSKLGQSEWHNAGQPPALSPRLIWRFRCARNIDSHRCTGDLLRNQWSARRHRGYHPVALYLGCDPLRTRVRGWRTGSRTT